MEDKLGSDMIDGKFVDWDNMTQEESKKMKLFVKLMKNLNLIAIRLTIILDKIII